MNYRAVLVKEGRSDLSRDLQDTHDPDQTISEFRSSHQLVGTSCNAIVELLEFATCFNSRAETYRALLDRLIKVLEEAMPRMSTQAQDLLLEKSFPFLTTDFPIRAIPITLLKRRQGPAPIIYLQELACEPLLRDALSKMPLAIQQQGLACHHYFVDKNVLK